MRSLHSSGGVKPRGSEQDHPDWKNYTFVKVHLRNLPQNVTTVEVYFNLRQFGNVNSISLHDTRTGYRSSTAEVIFRPPPTTPPWRYPAGIPFRRDGAASSFTHVYASFHHDQRKNFTVENKISHLVYNEETKIPIRSMHFGVLKNETEMDVMHTVQTSPVSALQLVLNLRRSEIDICFPIFLLSSNSPRVRSYRFHVALDESFRIFRRVNDDDGSTTLILNVRNPPWYSRRREDKINLSHVPDAKRWKEDDLWVRQTDIVQHKDDFAVVDQTPIALRKNLNIINISRWTTFALNVGKEAEDACQIFVKALEDFSTRVLDASNFTVNREHHDPEPRYWKLLDKPSSSRSTLAIEMGIIELPFEVRYQLEVCISHGWLSEYEIGGEFLHRLAAMTDHKAKLLLIHVATYAQRVFNPMDIFTNIQYHNPVKARQMPSNCIEVHHATVTATGLLVDTPSVEISNRIIRKYRHYANRFLRVRFEDDDYRGQTKLFASNNGKMVLVFDRVKRALKHGVHVAGRKYDFLAWGNSQLRDHGCYFFAAEGGVSVSTIRAEMGAFDNEKIVAKRAARMGQCFSTTQPVSLRMQPISQHTTIPDIVHGRYTFSDGVGKISPFAAQLVHANLKLPGDVPSCYQFRLGGCKGILAIDPQMKGIGIQVRASQFKFASSSQELEIIRHSEFWQPFLNRQLILVLSALGVPNDVFINMQKQTMETLSKAMNDEKVAMKALRDTVDPNRMTLTICDLIQDGFQRIREPFVMSLLHLWRAWSLKFLKEKAKIPVSKGAFVLGTVDETCSLRGHFDGVAVAPPAEASQEERIKTLPEIFLQIIDPQTGKRKIIEGVCILARNPSLHKGDIRVVKAIDVEALHQLVDCVVMPQTGDRDLPSMCSGGDLDGDDYIVSWDENLLPKIWNAPPFHYDAPPPKQAIGEFTIGLMIDFYYDYLQNDFLGRIAHAHLGAADFLTNDIESQECLELLHLHSMAVDYPKTGIPADLPRRLERTEWPHFMEKRGKSYHSHKVLGQLYDAVKREDFKPCYEQDFDRRILDSPKPSEGIEQQARFLKHEYDLALRRIMVQHKIRTEFEVWSTFILDHSKAARDYKFHEEIGQLSRSLKEQFYQAIVEVSEGNTFDHLKEFAVAAYQITAEEHRSGLALRQANPVQEKMPEMPFISFPWLLADTLGKVASSAIVRSKEATEQGMAKSAVKPPTTQNGSGSSPVTQAKGSDQDSEIIKIENPAVAAVDTADSANRKIDPFASVDPFETLARTSTQKTTKRNSSSSTLNSGESTHEDDSLLHVSRDSSLAGSHTGNSQDKESFAAPRDIEGDPADMTPEQLAVMFGTDEDEGL